MAAITDISQHYVRSPLAHTVITPLPKSDKVRSIKNTLIAQIPLADTSGVISLMIAIGWL